jgi:hypothetical protein
MVEEERRFCLFDEFGDFARELAVGDRDAGPVDARGRAGDPLRDGERRTAAHKRACRTGLGWLGGPVLIAIALHAVFCVLMLFALMIVMRSIARAFDIVVAVLVAIVLCTREQRRHSFGAPAVVASSSAVRRSPLASASAHLPSNSQRNKL